MADFDFNELKDKITDLAKTDDFTASYDPADVEKNKGMAILAYFSWLVLIPLLMAKDSKFARFHCNQGLILAVISSAVGIVFGALSAIPAIGFLFGLIGAAVSLAPLALMFMGVVNAVNGEAKDLPVIGKYKFLK